jgi:hypothetical protein
MTKSPDLSDAELDRLLTAGRPRPPEGDHPGDAALLDHARGAIEGEAAEQLEAHLAACADCRGLRLELQRNLARRPLGRVYRLRPLVLVPVAIAAAVALFVLIQPGSSAPNIEATLLSSGLAELRGPNEVSNTFDPRAPIEVELRLKNEPLTWAEQEYAVAVFSRTETGDELRIDQVQTSTNGYVLIVKVTAGDLGPPGSRRKLVVAVSKKGLNFEQEYPVVIAPP